jgi:uncharacterized protein
MKPLCLYHRSDLDGKCSGHIVSRFVPEVELLGVEYGDDLPWDQFEGRTIYLVDFSLQPWSEMERLAKVSEHLIWIDHHKSAIEEYDRSGLHLDSRLEMEKAACELCWYYFSSDPIPRAVWLLGRYDIWQLNADDLVLPFQMGMRLDTWAPDDSRWDVFFGTEPEEEIYSIAKDGDVVLKYQTNTNRRIMSKAFVHQWQDLCFLVVNADGINSQAFESRFDSEHHHAVMSFFYDGNQRKWTVSMYSPDQSRDLSVLAKKMGGGGHASACGFQIASLEEIGL